MLALHLFLEAQLLLRGVMVVLVFSREVFPSHQPSMETFTHDSSSSRWRFRVAQGNINRGSTDGHDSDSMSGFQYRTSTRRYHSSVKTPDE